MERRTLLIADITMTSISKKMRISLQPQTNKLKLRENLLRGLDTKVVCDGGGSIYITLTLPLSTCPAQNKMTSIFFMLQLKGY